MPSLKELIDLRIRESEMQVETSKSLAESRQKEYLVKQAEYECHKETLWGLKELKKQYEKESDDTENKDFSVSEEDARLMKEGYVCFCTECKTKKYGMTCKSCFEEAGLKYD